VFRYDATTFTFTFSLLADAFIEKRLTYVRLTMYTHFTFTLMAHCTSGAIRGSVSCSRTLRQGIKLATFCLLNGFSTYCTTVAPILKCFSFILNSQRFMTSFTLPHLNRH